MTDIPCTISARCSSELKNWIVGQAAVMGKNESEFIVYILTEIKKQQDARENGLWKRIFG